MWAVGREVEDPERFGVAVFDDDGVLIDIVEKPSEPPSSFAIGGIYLLDETFWDRLDSVVSEMGQSMSISDVNRTYVYDGKASIIESENSLWIDCGTPDALFEASVLAEAGKLSPEPCNYRDVTLTLSSKMGAYNEDETNAIFSKPIAPVVRWEFNHDGDLHLFSMLFILVKMGL